MSCCNLLLNTIRFPSSNGTCVQARISEKSSMRTVQMLGVKRELMKPQQHYWQQADLSNTTHPFDNVLGSIIAWDEKRNATLVGTAFLVDIHEGKAIAITAAHNFSGIQQAQRPFRTHHASTLPEFLGNMDKVDLDKKKVRVICSRNGSIEVAIVTLAGWDKSQDIGFMLLEPQVNKDFFSSTISLRATPPQIGEEVALLGYSDMGLEDQSMQGDESESLRMKRRLLLRKGTITAEYPDGHLLCRGPCVETSIPVFPGMSGGPALLLGENGKAICAFGLISSDSNGSDEEKNNFSLRGNSIVALLHAETKQTNNGKEVVAVKFNSPFFSDNRPR
jgi:hypothetical protein